MLWWIVSLTILVASVITKNINAMAVSGIFAIAGAISYVGVVIKDVIKNIVSKDNNNL